MRKSDLVNNFETPQRQSLLAIVLIVYKFYKIILRQAWPIFLIVFVSNRKSINDSWQTYVLYAVIVLSLISMFFAILNYFKFYFHIADDELHVSKGVFKKQKISIPLERVQTINFEENIFHRLFKVTSLKIDTAGSIKKEFDLDAINLKDAKEIRDYILSKKKDLVTSEDILENVGETEPVVEEEKLITKLSIGDLLKIGVSYNHLKSAGIIFGGLIWFYTELDDLIPDLLPDNLSEEQMVHAAFETGIIMTGTLMIMFLIISFFYSMIRSVLRYYDLNFKRRGKGFKIISGLFTRQEFSALDQKIQQVGWKDNLLQKKLFGIHDFSLKQAGSVAINSKKSFVVPGVSKNKIADIINYHFDNLDLSEFKLHAVDIRMFYRTVLYLFLFMFLASITLYNLFGIEQVIFMVFLFLCFSFINYKKYKKTKYGISQDVLQLRGGTFGDESVLIKLHKIQSVEIRQTPYQKRKDLASLKIFTASGTNALPYISLSKAKSISDFLLYKVETSKKSWM